MEDNWLLVKVLDMLAILVKYGYYDSPTDVDVILERLVSILNGFTDLPAPSSDTGMKEKRTTMLQCNQVKHCDSCINMHEAYMSVVYAVFLCRPTKDLEATQTD